MSTGVELSVIMPVINAPFRLYYAYNPLRLYESPYCNDVLIGGNKGSCSAELITRDLFPPGGAGDSLGMSYSSSLSAWPAAPVEPSPPAQVT
jgi:outer membrane protein insertion porin family